MTSEPPTPVSAAPVDARRIEPIGHAEAMRLQASELDATLRMLRSLPPEAWQAPTDCPAWDVRRMYLHVLGACEAGASMRENLRQMRAGRAHQKAHGGPLEAGLSAVQVAAREELTSEQLVQRLAAIAPTTITKRTKMPSLMRRVPMKVDGPVVETWRLGYLLDQIYLRDLWMHRIDAARATAADLELRPDHDGRIVADVVAEWARRHGRPFALTLTGPAGGTFTAGAPGEADGIELDAVELCRTLAGREPGEGLLATIVPF